MLKENILGVDNQLIQPVKELCARVGQTAVPFEHILVVTGNAGQRTVSIVWCILGFEVHRFRLTTNWRGTDFTYLVKCPVLRNQHPSSLIDCNLPIRIGPRTNACSAPSNPSAMQAEFEAIAEHRLDAQSRATILVVNSSNQAQRWLHDITSLEVAPANGEGLISEGLRVLFLQRFYGVASKQESHRLCLHALVEEELGKMPASVVQQTVARDSRQALHVDWPRWIDAVRNILDRAVDRIGPPRSEYARHIRIEEAEPK